MKKLTAMVLVLILCACCALPAAAAGKVSVTQENFHVVDGFWPCAYVYAKVENTGDKPVKVNALLYEAFDAEGNAIISEDYGSYYAEYLQPGEYTYVKTYDDFDEGVVPVDYALDISGKSEDDYVTLRLPVETDMELNVEDGFWTYNYMYATLTNDTDQPLFNISVVMALLDAEGNILYMDEDNLYSERALMPGSGMIIRKDINSDFINYFEADGLIPASVDAIAYVNVPQN